MQRLCANSWGPPIRGSKSLSSRQSSGSKRPTARCRSRPNPSRQSAAPLVNASGVKPNPRTITMPNATLRANAQALPEATSRRAILGAVLAAGALAAVPANSVAASLGMEPELQALIAAWHEAERRLDETYDASCAADERAWCPVPQALIATERDASLTIGTSRSPAWSIERPMSSNCEGGCLYRARRSPFIESFLVLTSMAGPMKSLSRGITGRPSENRPRSAKAAPPWLISGAKRSKIITQ
jgi:hypothetical protein